MKTVLTVKRSPSFPANKPRARGEVGGVWGEARVLEIPEGFEESMHILSVFVTHKTSTGTVQPLLVFSICFYLSIEYSTTNLVTNP